MPNEEEKTATPGDSNSDKEIIKEALEQFRESDENSYHNRESYEDDIKFGRLGDQWPDKVRRDRELDARPCLTINKFPASIRQVINDARQNKPSINVHPVGNDADKDTAEVIEGLVRSIERNSQADTAYMTAFDNAVSGGFGFFTIGVDFANDDTFDMEARIDRVPNSLSVHWDGNTSRFDAEDWRYAFISETMKKEDFEARYPKAEVVDFESDDAAGFNSNLDNDDVRVSAYWKKTEVKRKILLLSDGSTIRDELLDDEIKQFLEVQGLTVVRERQVIANELTRYVISGSEVLESDPWPGELIPVCPVWGEEIVIDGRRYTRSMIADSKDSQRNFNYWRSASTELVALAPKAPFMLEEGAIPEGEEYKYETANSRSYAYMSYKRGFNRPGREPFAGVPAGALQESLNSSDDIKSTMGIFDASLGAQGNETSGKAILARQRQGDVSQFHFVDNLSRAINYAGRVLVEIIPHVYTPRNTIRILGIDGKEKVIKLASGQLQPDKVSGNDQLYDLNVGKYDVTVKAGPSYQSQREEAREVLLEIMKALPDSGALIGDKVMEHMDFQGADDIAKRLKLMLPPQIQKAEAEEENADIPPEAQQAIAQAQQETAQLKQQLQQGSQILQESLQKTKTLEEGAVNEQKKMEIEGDKAVRSAQLDEMKLINERAKLKNENDKNELTALQIAEKTEGQDKIAALESNVNQIAVAIQQSSNQDAAATEALIETLNAPVEIVRDEEGRAVTIVPTATENSNNGV